MWLAIAVSGIFTKNFLTCKIIECYTKFDICFDNDMNFLSDSNMTIVIVTINKLAHLVKLYYSTIVDCEQYVWSASNVCSKLYAFYLYVEFIF